MTIRPGTTPSADTYELEELVALAWSGKIWVPRFQRPFRWETQDAVRLFDSIVKGYPIGSLLLWQRSAPPGPVRLGALTFERATEGTLAVVDGQQRITTLANALYPQGTPDQEFRLAYDLQVQRFTRASTSSDPRTVPLPVLFGSELLLDWFRVNPGVTDYFPQANAVNRALRQYKIPAYIVSSDDEHTLEEIFDRLNNAGKRLRRDEVFAALHIGGNDELSFDAIARRVDVALNFGLIDNGTVMQALLARRGPDVRRDIHNEFGAAHRNIDFPHEDRDAAFAAGEAALRRAVEFVQNSCRTPHVSMLAYSYLLIVLTRFFAHHPQPDDRTRILLRRWFWRAAVLGPGIFPAGTTGASRIMNTAIQPGDTTASIMRLLATIEGYTAHLPSLSRFRTNMASTKIVLCSWWHLEPRRPVGDDAHDIGSPYQKAELAAILESHTTAKSAVFPILQSRSLPKEDQIRAANWILLAGEAPGSELDRVLGYRPPHVDEATWQAVLRSHQIDPVAVSALQAGDDASFLAVRTETMQQTLGRFIASMCEWDFEDTPSLSSLTIEDLDSEDDDDAASAVTLHDP